MIVVCQQPNYFPWLGYLEQCARADALVVLDSVQWIRRGWQHRIRILPQPGAPADEQFQWLTLPVHGHGHREMPLREIRLDRSSRWWKHHWAKLQSTYGRAPRFRDQLEPLVRPWLETEAPRMETLRDAATSSTLLCLRALGYEPPVRFSSDLPEEGTKSRRLVSLCGAMGAGTYYTGVGTSYIEGQLFRDAGIELVWQRWKHPVYAQRPATAFRSHLSVLDALAFVPVAEIQEWLAIKPWHPLGEMSRAYLADSR